MSDDEQRPPGDFGPGDFGEVGSVGDEAAKLFGAIADWAREHGQGPGGQSGQSSGQSSGQQSGQQPGPGLGDGLAGLAGQAARAARDIDAHVATDDPECRWCPVCRTIHLVRQCTPEVRDQLGVAAAHLMQAAAGLLVAASAPDRRDRAPGEGVQHIDLDDGPDGPGDAGPTDDGPPGGSP